MANCPKVDFKNSLKPLFSGSKTQFEAIDVPLLRFLMVDGRGAPVESRAYQLALGILYPAAYGLKFFSKIALGRDYVVPPLQGLWWSDRLDAFTSDRRDEWQWTMMIMVPDWITSDDFDQAMADAARKKPGLEFGPLRMDVLDEGRCLQKLHIGSYAQEAPVLHQLHHETMPGLGLTFNGKHHEIYLGDPRRVPPQKLRTILRQPVRPV